MSDPSKYKILRKLADGGMAEVFLAQLAGSHGFEKMVVLKRIRPSLSSTPRFRDVLLNEAHVAMRLNHSNIVQVLDLGESGGRFFLCLELVEGWTVEQLLRRSRAGEFPLPPELALHIAVEVCRALAYAHGATSEGKPLGIVHRDVSPQNILVSEQGEVKLADFGIAKVSSRSETTQNGMVKGKVSFMSPEQASAAPLDGRSDRFSLGTVLYYMVTDQLPFTGPSVAETMAQIVSGKWVPAQKAKPGLDRGLCKVISTSLRLKASARFQTADAMLHELERVMRRSFAPVGRTELKAWLSELSARDHELPIGRATLSDFKPAEAEDQSVEIVTSSMIVPTGVSLPPKASAPSHSVSIELGSDSIRAPAAARRRRAVLAIGGLGLTLSVLAIATPIGRRAVDDAASLSNKARLSGPQNPQLVASARSGAPASTPSPSEVHAPAEPASPASADPPVNVEEELNRSPVNVEEELNRSVVASPAEVVLGEKEAVAVPGTGDEGESRAQASEGSHASANSHPADPVASEHDAAPSRATKPTNAPVGSASPAPKRVASVSGAKAALQKPKDDTVSVAFATVPGGALIKVRNDVRHRLFGPTPISLRFRPGILYEVTFLRRGYAPETRQFTVASRKNQKVVAQMKKASNVRKK